MKIDKYRSNLKDRCQLVSTYLKKKAHYIKRAYNGEVYLSWCSDHPFKIVLIEYPLRINGPLPSEDIPPPYPTPTEAFHSFKPQELVRCLDDSAQTLHEISDEVSQSLLRSMFIEKNEGMPYQSMAGRLYKSVHQLQEVRARELSELLDTSGEVA